MTDDSRQLLYALLEEHDHEKTDLYAETEQIALDDPAMAEVAVDTLMEYLDTKFCEYLESSAAKSSVEASDLENAEIVTLGSRERVNLYRESSLTRIPWELFKMSVHAETPPEMTEALDTVCQLTTVPDPNIRCHALPALAVIGVRSNSNQAQTALEYLHSRLDSEIPRERALALWGLAEFCLFAPGLIGSPEPIRKRLVDTCQCVRLNAADACLALLLKGHADPGVRRNEVLSLVDSASPLGKDTVRRLAELGLREALEASPKRLKQNYGTRRVRDLLDGHGLVTDFLPSLEALSESQAPEDRLVAGATIGLIGIGEKVDDELHESTLKSLNRLYTDENKAVRTVAKWVYNEGPHVWSCNVGSENCEGHKETNENTVDAAELTVQLPAGVSEIPDNDVQNRDFDLTGLRVEPGDILSIELPADVVDVEPPDTDDSEYTVYEVPIEVTVTIPESPVIVSDRTILNTDTAIDGTVDDWQPENAVPTKKDNSLEQLFA